MVTGLDILGATASALQIAVMICTFGNRVLEKPKDSKALRTLCTDLHRYVDYLKQWELVTKDEASAACQNLRQKLQSIIEEVERLPHRKIPMKTIHCLKLYTPEFRAKFSDALREFKFRICSESHKSINEVEEKLAEMTTGMQELQITSKTLNNLPGMEASIAKVDERIKELSYEIKSVTEALGNVQSTLNELKIVETGQIKDAIASDGDVTRACIHEFTTKIVNQLDAISDRLDLNESVTRIRTEILPNNQPLVWHNESTFESHQHFKVWSLDYDLSNATEQPRPDVAMNGLELSSSRLSDDYDGIVTRRSMADEIDDDLRHKKRRRIFEISPYVGLAKRGNVLEELKEYVPPKMRERFDRLSPGRQIEALRIARTLSQEYRYLVLDRILDNVDTISNISLLEDMERAMLAVNAEKLRVSLGFALEQTVDNVDFVYKLQVDITRHIHAIARD